MMKRMSGLVVGRSLGCLSSHCPSQQDIPLLFLEASMVMRNTPILVVKILLVGVAVVDAVILITAIINLDIIYEKY